MKNQPTTSNINLLMRIPKTAVATALLTIALALTASVTQAGSATWKANPATGDWFTATNWMPRTVPNGPSDIATFGLSNVTSVAISADTEVNSIVFKTGSSSYNISAPASLSGPMLTISGVGLANDSALTQNFSADPGEPGGQGINFTGNATAGTETVFTIGGGTFSGQTGGLVQFFGSSTAAQGTFILERATDAEASGGSLSFFESSSAGTAIFLTNSNTAGGALQFFDISTAESGNFSGTGLILFSGNSTAGSSNITLDGDATGTGGAGFVLFFDNASAVDATLTGNGGGVDLSAGATIYFSSNSDAANATLIAHGDVLTAGGGRIYLADTCFGGTSAIKVYDNGTLDVSLHDPSGVTIGSLEGNGVTVLGATPLSIGSSNSNTTFSGLMQDGFASAGGSLTKIGTGTLTLSNANTYTGGTTVSAGMLLVTNRRGSGTGTGSVLVEGGTLGGTGKIGGRVTVGTGNSTGAFISPGTGGNNAGVLTIQKKLILKADSTYNCGLRTNNATADRVVANGVTIESGALFAFRAIGSTKLTVGTIFTVLSNKAATPIAGVFSNVPDGSTFSVGPNTFQANYEGGDGNDLTLNVIP